MTSKSINIAWSFNIGAFVVFIETDQQKAVQNVEEKGDHDGNESS